MIHTRICDLLSIDYPIFQGGMAWVSDGKLAAAVSSGGGLGLIAAMNADAAFVKEQIAVARSLTDRPFGVNVMLMSPFAGEVAAILCEEKVPVAVTGAGNPGKYMKAWLEAGIKVIPVIASTAMAKMVIRSGACAVVAEGCESGGHIGELTTMALVPQVADVCKQTNTPVIAAGGIADGRGVAAAFMLGAEGVQLGTRFLVAEECGVHPHYKAKVLKAGDIDTVATGRRLGHPVRSLKTAFARNYMKYEYDPQVTGDELEALGAGALRKAAVEGDELEGCFLAGQIAGLVTREQPAADIIREVFDEAEAILKDSAKWVK